MAKQISIPWQFYRTRGAKIQYPQQLLRLEWEYLCAKTVPQWIIKWNTHINRIASFFFSSDVIYQHQKLKNF